ncbi:MAG: type II 3-dehydroquinate dehydratase [bacterium]
MNGPTRNRVAVMHGVNLNMLGKRDPEHYGTMTLSELENQIRKWAKEFDLEPITYQSNSESAFIEFLHRLPDTADALVVNPGAWTHYSWAIRDAVEIAGLPTIEVHLSDVDQREQWRRVSVLEGLTVARVAGKGPDGYREALEELRAVLVS